MTSPFRGLLTVMAAILIGASPLRGVHAQDDGLPRVNAAHLRTILEQDLELRKNHAIIQGGRTAPLQDVLPCLLDPGRTERIAGDFREATGVELSAFVAAVRRDDRDPEVWRGYYEDYSLLSTVRIATAPLVDPDLLPRLGTAYAFPLADVLAAGDDRRELTVQVLDGSAGLAEHRVGHYMLIPPGSDNWKHAVSLMQEGGERQRQSVVMRAGAGSDQSGPDIHTLRLLTRRDALQGVNSSTRVIAWDTDKPLNTVLLETYRAALVKSMRTAAATCGDHEMRQAIPDQRGASPDPR